MDLSGARVIVTGGTGGLGRVLCDGFAEAGADVLLVYRQSEALAHELAAKLAARHGVRVIPCRADTSSEDGQAAIERSARDILGGVDVLVNNAATHEVVAFKDLDGLTPDIWDDIAGTNVRGPFLLTRALAPLLRADPGGRVVNISSIAGLIPSGSSIAYAVSKAGLIHLTRCLAVALAPEVLVNCIAPGMLEGTRMTEDLSPEFRRSAVERTVLKVEAAKEDVARQAITFCRSDTITGQTVVVDSGVVFH